MSKQTLNLEASAKQWAVSKLGLKSEHEKHLENLHSILFLIAGEEFKTEDKQSILWTYNSLRCLVEECMEVAK